MEWLDFDFNLPITDPTWIFLLVLLIILFAPMVLGRLRIPHIIGMILRHWTLTPAFSRFESW